MCLTIACATVVARPAALASGRLSPAGDAPCGRGHGRRGQRPVPRGTTCTLAHHPCTPHWLPGPGDGAGATTRGRPAARSRRRPSGPVTTLAIDALLAVGGRRSLGSGRRRCQPDAPIRGHEARPGVGACALALRMALTLAAGRAESSKPCRLLTAPGVSPPAWPPPLQITASLCIHKYMYMYM